jgi:hypothetical protein
MCLAILALAIAPFFWRTIPLPRWAMNWCTLAGALVLYVLIRIPAMTIYYYRTGRRLERVAFSSPPDAAPQPLNQLLNDVSALHPSRYYGHYVSKHPEETRWHLNVAAMDAVEFYREGKDIAEMLPIPFDLRVPLQRVSLGYRWRERMRRSESEGGMTVGHGA